MNRRWVKDGEVWDAAGITGGIDLARVCFDKDVGWKERGIMEEVQSLTDTLSLVPLTWRGRA